MILDEQSLTYAELFQASQLVAQCLERSIEMFIGELSIVISGASYSPLSPNQPAA